MARLDPFGTHIRTNFCVQMMFDLLESAIFNFQSLLIVILLLICTCTYLKGLFPSIIKRRAGYLGTFWKCARIGERKSPWVSVFCIVMAVSILFLK